MVRKEIVDYLEKGIERKFSVQRLKEELLKGGFSEVEVDEAIASMNLIEESNTSVINSNKSSVNSVAKSEERIIKHRNVIVVYLLMFITFGIYGMYWTVSTKRDINSLGADIPTAWLIIVPIANIYFMYKYYEGFAKFVKKDNNVVLWVLLGFFAGIIMPAVIQSELNKFSNN